MVFLPWDVGLMTKGSPSPPIAKFCLPSLISIAAEHSNSSYSRLRLICFLGRASKDLYLADRSGICSSLGFCFVMAGRKKISICDTTREEMGKEVNIQYKIFKK